MDKWFTPNADMPEVDAVPALDLAREAIAHHAGMNVLRGRLNQPLPYKMSPGPWRAGVIVQSGAPVRYPDYDPSDPLFGTTRTVCRLGIGDGGEPELQVFCTVGKAEIEWAHADLICRMREREPVIAAECVRLAKENEQLRRRLDELDELRQLVRVPQ